MISSSDILNIEKKDKYKHTSNMTAQTSVTLEFWAHRRHSGCLWRHGVGMGSSTDHYHHTVRVTARKSGSWTLRAAALRIGRAGSDNGLVPSSNKPLPESMLTKFYKAILYGKQWVWRDRVRMRCKSDYQPCLCKSLNLKDHPECTNTSH